MRTRLTLRPSQDGAKQLRAQYGDRLICVRYRYDDQQKKRYKTVELIVEENRWEPPSCPPKGHTMVWVRIALLEAEVRQQMKGAGGKWHPQRRLWELRYDQAIAVGLSKRIVRDGGL
jgi:hypothetical protein